MSRIAIARERHESIIKYIESMGGMARKMHGGGYGDSVGEADIIGCLPQLGGRMIHIELKRPGLHRKPVQEATARLWEKAGALTTEAHNRKEVQEFVERCISEYNASRV